LGSYPSLYITNFPGQFNSAFHHSRVGKSCTSLPGWAYDGAGLPAGLGVVLKFLKFVLKCPEIGVRSWNSYTYPEIFRDFTKDL